MLSLFISPLNPGVGNAASHRIGFIRIAVSCEPADMSIRITHVHALAVAHHAERGLKSRIVWTELLFGVPVTVAVHEYFRGMLEVGQF